MYVMYHVIYVISILKNNLMCGRDFKKITFALSNSGEKPNVHSIKEHPKIIKKNVVG